MANQDIITFCIQKGYQGREKLAIMASAGSLGVECVYSDVALEGAIPIGTVEFCLPVFGEHRIDFFPDFLKGHLHRGSGVLTGSDTLIDNSFVKDAAAWKGEWESGVYPAGTRIPDGEWILSEPVSFAQEWRYYVAKGGLITTGWYQGCDEDEEAPALDVEWPDNFSGAVDFGRLDDGRMALVEAHAPFGCGWYGNNHEMYALWMVFAWENRSWWLK